LIKKKISTAFFVLLLAASCALRASAETPLPIDAVVVTFWQLTGDNEDLLGERNLWFEEGNFTEHLPLPSRRVVSQIPLAEREGGDVP